MYSKSKCHSPDYMIIATDSGIVNKIFPYTYDVRPEDEANPCPAFKANIGFKFKLGISQIRLIWFKYRYPEKLL